MSGAARGRDASTLTLSVLIERKQAALPAYVVVPAGKLRPWKLTGTTTVEGTLDGAPLGRRSLKAWDATRWFIELRREPLAAIGKAPGERARLVLQLAATGLPAELQALIAADPAARARWEAHTPAQQRMLREHVLEAKTAATREQRVRRALLPQAAPVPEAVKGLKAAPRALRVRIVARHLPGRRCGEYSEVLVGLVDKAGCHPSELLPADRRELRWETDISVRARDDGPHFTGPAVNGPAGERFLYLTWLGRKSGAAPAMFRRAKLRLDAVPAAVLAAALRSGVLVGTLGLTAPDGMPLCASVRPPQIVWTSG